MAKNSLRVDLLVKVMVTNIWDMKGSITTDLLEKGATVNRDSSYQLFW